MTGSKGQTSTVTVDDAIPQLANVDIAVPRPVPWDGILPRLRGSQGLRRLVPAPLAMSALDAGQALAARRDPGRLAAARTAMAAVVGGTAREPELEELARRHLGAQAHGWELMFRPWLLEAMPFTGLEAVLDIEPGRGIVFSTPHYGPQIGLARLPQHVGPVDVAIGDHLYANEALPGYHGYQNEQTRKVLGRNGYRMVRAIGSARTFTSTLASGGRVLINFDVPGKTPVQFLGKTVELASGTARLAEQTDSVVVPALPRPSGRGWYAYLDTPLDPRQHNGWEHLLQATADAMSRLILEAPEYLEDPLRESGWAVATPDGWRRTA